MTADRNPRLDAAASNCVMALTAMDAQGTKGELARTLLTMPRIELIDTVACMTGWLNAALEIIMLMRPGGPDEGPTKAELLADLGMSAATGEWTPDIRRFGNPS
jgi:hypothetical protein